MGQEGTVVVCVIGLIAAMSFLSAGADSQSHLTHFIALKVTGPDMSSYAQNFAQRCDEATGNKDVSVKGAKTYHITLNVLDLSKPQLQDRTVNILEGLSTELSKLIPKELAFNEVSAFWIDESHEMGTAVFLEPKISDSLAQATDLILRHLREEQIISDQIWKETKLTEDNGLYRPDKFHLTLAGMRNPARPIPAAMIIDSIKDVKLPAGSIASLELSLLSSSGKGNDGYYTSDYTLDLQVFPK